MHYYYCCHTSNKYLFSHQSQEFSHEHWNFLTLFFKNFLYVFCSKQILSTTHINSHINWHKCEWLLWFPSFQFYFGLSAPINKSTFGGDFLSLLVLFALTFEITGEIWCVCSFVDETLDSGYIWSLAIIHVITSRSN